MSKYPIARSLAVLSHFRLPMWRPLIAAANCALQLYQEFMSYAGKRYIIASEDGARLEMLCHEPKGVTGKSPAIIYFHGGGFVLKASWMHFILTRQYAKRLGCRIFIPDYRLAPKHAFPCAVEDCFAAYKYAVENADALGLDRDRIGILGDSAGGNLAAAVSLMARDRYDVQPAFSVLIYPVLDRRMQTSSMKDYHDTPIWNSRSNEIMWQWYLKDGLRGFDKAYCSPAEADSLAGLPPTYVETADVDCLRDEGQLYAEALKRAGVETETFFQAGTPHGFELCYRSELTKNSVDRRVAFMKKILSNG